VNAFSGEHVNTAVDVTNTPGLIETPDKSMFASLKNSDYLYLWVGMLGSAFALNMQLVAQGWLVYEMTASAMNLTWVTLAFMVPQVVFSLVGGVLADRLPKKPVIMWAPAANALATFILAIIVITGHVTFWDFIWVSAFNGTIMALSIPARTAFIPEIVGEKLMFNAMAYNTASWNLSRILGPALAGFMIAIFADGDTTSTYGVGLVYFVLSALYLISCITVVFIKHHGKPTPGQKKSPLNDIRDGLSYVLNSPIVGGLILLSIIPFLFGLSINTLLPAFNTDVLAGGADDLGLLMTAMGIGAIAGSVLLANMGNLRHKGYWLLLTGSLWGVGVAMFSLCTTYLLASICMGFVGFISSINMAMNRGVVQLQVTQSMRGRIMSIDMMSHGLMPLGMLPIGWIAETYSIQAGLATSGMILAVVTIVLGFYMPKIRAINTGFPGRST
jgi:MFS family permease